MDNVAWLPRGRYVVAVSGGVDSMSLLHVLCNRPELELVVAHFDHAMRPDSAEDQELVAKTAEHLRLEYITRRAVPNSLKSEASARQARYGFLEDVRIHYGAAAIITAHHADDVIETMIINLLRGSGWRGLSSLRSRPDRLRPLLHIPKQNIIAYAAARGLTWREDSTNSQTDIMRNDIRHNLLPRLDKQAWLELYRAQEDLRQKIDTELALFDSWRRHDFIMWPGEVSLEVLRSRFKLTRPQARQLLEALKTARPAKSLVLGKQHFIFSKDQFMLK